ncbi:hypothetical protein L6Q96_16225 [Candidatus Binatia bacterium]|nr:hypothetical protein [Candidatus Binatia bacterium]
MRGVSMLLVGVVVYAGFLGAVPGRAQQCDDYDECTGAGTCGPDDICQPGQPLPNGTACNAPASGECLPNPTCLDGMCAGGTSAASGSPCHLMNSACFTAGTCFVIPTFPGIPAVPPVCMGSVPIECPDDGNPLTLEFCNPQVGRCESYNLCVSDECMQRQAVGNACQETPRNEGGPCDDFNECTTNTRCQEGTCAESSGTQPTATPMATPTPTPPPQPACTGDCGNDGEVTVEEIITMVNIANGTQSLSTCPRADGNGDVLVAIDDIISAVNNALAGCA